MKKYPMPKQFSGSKFAARYNLSATLPAEFWSDGQFLYVPDSLPDDPPIFEAPDPPIPQGVLKWEASEIPGAVRLVAEFNGKKSAIVGAVGVDSSLAAMYQSPGPVGPQPAGPRREFHVAALANIDDIPTTVVDGDTLYVESDGEYRFTGGAWRRVLTGPALGSPGDQINLYSALDAAMDAIIAGSGGPPVNPKIVNFVTELRKLI